MTKLASRFSLVVLMLVGLLFVNPTNIMAEEYDDVSGFDFDIVFVIDNSHSMTNADPQGVALTAANLFVDLNRGHNSRAGFILYSHTFETFNLRGIFDEDEANPVKTAIRNTQARRGGQTDIGGGLQRAWQLLENEEDRSRHPVVILLSDGNIWLSGGYETPAALASHAMVDYYVPLFASAGIRVHTIGFNYDGSLDIPFMRSIAERTGATFHEVTEAIELPIVLSNIYASEVTTPHPDLAGGIVFEEIASFVGDGNRQRVAVPILNNSIFEANVIIYHSRPISNVMVFNPSGAQLAIPGNNLTLIQENAYTILKMRNPVEGMWHIEFTGSYGDYIMAQMLSTYDIQLGLGVRNRQNLIQGERVTFYAYLSDLQDPDSTFEDEALFGQANFTLHISDSLGRAITSVSGEGSGSLTISPFNEPGNYRARLEMEFDGHFRYSEEIAFTILPAGIAVNQDISIPFMLSRFLMNEFRFPIDDVIQYHPGSTLIINFNYDHEIFTAHRDYYTHEFVVVGNLSWWPWQGESTIEITNTWGAPPAEVRINAFVFPFEIVALVALFIALLIAWRIVRGIRNNRPTFADCEYDEILVRIDDLPNGMPPEEVALKMPGNALKVSLAELFDTNIAVGRYYQDALQEITRFTEQFIFQPVRRKNPSGRNTTQVKMLVPKGVFGNYEVDSGVSSTKNYDPEKEFAIIIGNRDNDSDEQYKIVFGKKPEHEDYWG